MDSDDECAPTYYVSIDPGTVNMGVAVISVEMGSPKVSWSTTVNVLTDESVDVDKIDSVLNLALYQIPPMDRGSETWVLEYQPPIHSLQNPGLIRKNSYVEGAVRMWMQARGVRKFKVVAPSAVKRFFKFPVSEQRSQYYSNKRHAIEAIETYTGHRPENDHIADCVLNALYAHLKEQEKR